MTITSATSYISEMASAEFDAMFHELAGSEAFSAIASGIVAPKHIESVRKSLLKMDLPEQFCADDESICLLVGMIAGRVMQKL